jgi:hypothetical protein
MLTNGARVPHSFLQNHCATYRTSVHPLAWYARGCSHGIWWIIRSVITRPISGCFWSVGSSDGPPLPEAKLHPSASTGTFTDFLTIWHSSPIRLVWRSSGNRRQGAREHLARCPSPVGSSRCHRWRTLSVPLSQTFASSRSWLDERHSKRGMGTHKMIVRAPPLEMGEQVWRLLGCGPRATS